MKRVTFVLAGIVAITISVVLSQDNFDDESTKFVKVDTSKHYVEGIYD